MKPQPKANTTKVGGVNIGTGRIWLQNPEGRIVQECYPFYGRGSYIWVREGYQILSMSRTRRVVRMRYLAGPATLVYDKLLTETEWTKWRARKYPYRASPGRFMYRSLSRITLEVSNVWAEQIQDMTEEDAIAEGEHSGLFCARGQFQHIWNDLHKRDGYDWDQNPWVWRIEFKVVSPGD